MHFSAVYMSAFQYIIHLYIYAAHRRLLRRIRPLYMAGMHLDVGDQSAAILEWRRYYSDRMVNAYERIGHSTK